MQALIAASAMTSCAYGELGKQGSNLNQLAYAVNAGRLTALSADDRRVIDQTRIAVETATALIRALLA